MASNFPGTTTNSTEYFRFPILGISNDDSCYSWGCNFCFIPHRRLDVGVVPIVDMRFRDNVKRPTTVNLELDMSVSNFH